MVLVVGTASLEHGLVHTTTPSHDADSSTAGVLDPLLGARGETDLGASLVHVVGNDRGVVARAPLHVGDDGTLRHGLERHGVADHELGLSSAVDELARVGTLHGREKLLVKLVLASVVEMSTDERCATAGIMDDVLHDTLDEADALTEVEHTQLGGTLASTHMRFENGSATLTLAPDNTTHDYTLGVPM